MLLYLVNTTKYTICTNQIYRFNYQICMKGDRQGFSYGQFGHFSCLLQCISPISCVQLAPGVLIKPIFVCVVVVLTTCDHGFGFYLYILFSKFHFQVVLYFSLLLYCIVFFSQPRLAASLYICNAGRTTDDNNNNRGERGRRAHICGPTLESRAYIWFRTQCALKSEVAYPISQEPFSRSS